MPEPAEPAERAREAAVARFAALYTACPCGVALADSAGRIAEANPALAALLEVAPERLRDKDIASLGVHDDDRAQLRARLDELDAGLDGVRTDSELIELGHAEGKRTWSYVTLTSLPTDKPGVSYPVVFVEDADELRTLRETFEHQSVSDPLTNLANVSRFRSYLESTLGTAPDGQIALIYLDIDGFKVINDGLGSEAADEILRGIAGRLDAAFTVDTTSATDAAEVADAGLVARIAGDGFGIVLRGGFTAPDVIGLLERVLGDLAEPVYSADIGVGVCASAGIVVRPARGAEPNTLVEGAQIALHTAKHRGKAQWVLHEPETLSADRARYRLAAAIAGGLETGEFTIVYRPHVVLPDAEIVTSLRAELRWNHPEYGQLAAAEFYDLAETTGMIVPLGRQLLAFAAETAADWRARFGTDAPAVSLRLPSRLAVDGELVGIVKSELDRHDLPVSALRLCTDCPSILDSRGDFLDSLRVLAEQGATFVLDVTGSADLELVHTLRLPVPVVLLAGDVVDAMAVDAPSAAAQRHVAALVRRGGELGVAVGATGVCDEAHAARLYELGVRFAAGPYLGELTTRAQAEAAWAGRIQRT